MSELPKGWATSMLSGLFAFNYGKGLIQEKRNPKGSIKVYGSNGVVGVHDNAVTKGPTIIVGRKGSVGKIHFSPERCWPIDTAYFIDQFPCNFPPNYWAFYLKSLRLGQQDKSSAIHGISREDICKIEVPIPPLAEQRRIVAKLEKLLEKVDASQKRLAKIPILLKRFRQSVLAAACSGKLTADWRSANSAPPQGQDHPGKGGREQKIGASRRDAEAAEDLPELPESWQWIGLGHYGRCFRGRFSIRPRNDPRYFDGKCQSRSETAENWPV
ncbi:MAG: restriction endonuclease subunit S [Verrucomicrobia bacterium]|nr:restriction endonuclease subunit S [Verrucomicrobiota bacterium]